MKKFISLLLTTALLLLCVNPVISINNQAIKTETDYFHEAEEKNIVEICEGLAFVNNEIIVFFNDDTSEKEKQKIFDSLDATVVGCCDTVNEYQLRIKENDIYSLLKTAEKLRKNKNVSFATCNFLRQYSEDVIPTDPWTNASEDYTYGWDESRPNGGNWWLEVTQTLSAWEYEEYFNPITVGVLDSGFDATHEDLTGRIRFPNGFFEKYNAPQYHGLHVTGIIGANHNNDVGITGILKNADMLCVDWDADEDQKWISELRIITGFISLVKGGAKVINMSLGASSNVNPQNEFFWNILMQLDGALFSYIAASLLCRGYDFVVVQSAGNGNYLGYPTDSFHNGCFCSITEKNSIGFMLGVSKKEILDRIIVVGSICNSHEDNNFYMSSFSNYGEGVSIFAPGSKVYSCYTNNRYSDLSGTSMAAPVVTGITSLVWSVNPNLSGAEVKSIICDPENSIYTAVNYFEPDTEIPSAGVINAKLSVEDAIRTLGIEPEVKNSDKTEISEGTDFINAEEFRNEKGE